MEESMYDKIKNKSVYDNDQSVIITTASTGYDAINAILNAMPIEECDDVISRQAVLNKSFEIKTGENTSAMVVYAEDIRKELPVKPKLAFNERITTIPMPFE